MYKGKTVIKKFICVFVIALAVCLHAFITAEASEVTTEPAISADISNTTLISSELSDVSKRAVTVDENVTEELIIPANPDAVYGGIVMDGDFSDWDAVPKTWVVFPEKSADSEKSYAVAMVWDDDYIYLYYYMSGVDGAGNWDEITWKGTYNDGQWEIVTDLGYTLRFQLKNDGGGSIAGVNGAQVAVNNQEWFGAPHMWEIAIPASQLPAYRSTISLGLYHGDLILTDVANLQRDDHADASVEGIVYDGLYGDWTYYPHTSIGYAYGDGRTADVALYADGDLLYGHMTITGARYGVDYEADRDYSDQDWKKENWGLYQGLFSWMSLHVDKSEINDFGGSRTSMGLTIIPVPEWEEQYGSGRYDNDYNRSSKQENLTAYLTREFYILNVARNGEPIVIGSIIITVGPSGCEAEWMIEIEKIAEHFGVDATDLKMFGMQFIQIGPEWIWTAGTDTAPWLGAILCGTMAAGAIINPRRRRRKAGVQ